ncbi:MAG: hypothetical protein HQM03_00430 [Magnetococcales bacterium]|nr:hypothetical protein [Magnetococcales bacterium]
MANLRIVVSQRDYKILDEDAHRLICEGISSYRRALMLYERLIRLQEGELAWPSAGFAP